MGESIIIAQSLMTESMRMIIDNLINLITLLGLLGGGTFVVTKWVRPTSKHTETNNGKNLAEYAVDTSEGVKDISNKLDNLAKTVKDNSDKIQEARDIAINAKSSADTANSRLDVFLLSSRPGKE